MRRVLNFCIILVCMACGGGDGGDATGPTMVSISGTWNLQTVDGAALPYVVTQTGTEKIEITADVLTFTATGTFTEITAVRSTNSGQVTTQSVADAGNYTLTGNTLKAFYGDGSTITGTLNGNTLNATTQNLSLVYKKQ